MSQVFFSQMAPHAGVSMDNEESDKEEAAPEVIDLCFGKNDKIENEKNQKIKNQKNKSIDMNVKKVENQKAIDKPEDNKVSKVYRRYNPAPASISKDKFFPDEGKYPDDKDDDAEDEEDEENEENENPEEEEDEEEKEATKDEKDEDDEIEKLLVSRSIQEVPLEEYFTFRRVTLGNGDVVYVSRFNESFRCDVCSRKTKKLKVSKDAHADYCPQSKCFKGLVENLGKRVRAKGYSSLDDYIAEKYSGSFP